LVVNTVGSFLICQSCGIVVIRDEFPAHLVNKHAESKLRLDKDKFSNVLHQLNVAAEMPDIPTEVVLEYEGLPVADGFQCEECFTIRGNEPSILKHYQQAHRGIAKPAYWTRRHCQQFNHGSAKKMFPVIRRQRKAPSSTAETISALRREMAEENKRSDDRIDVRRISPWLLSTRWHLHVAGHDLAELRALVATQKDDFPTLRDHVVVYLQDATDLIDSTHELVLKYLNSPDPQKKCVPFLLGNGVFPHSFVFHSAALTILHSIVTSRIKPWRITLQFLYVYWKC
jgi:hypothetical protein